MPTNMRQFFSNEELQTATMHEPFNFTKNIPVMKVNRILRKTDPHKSLVNTKSALYNLKDDPEEFFNLWNHRGFEREKQEYILKCFDASVLSMDPDPPRLGPF